MTLYIASDVHLRLDHPERGRRFSRWVRGLEDGSSLLILGDLCDFWMGTRSSEAEMSACEGLRALADFVGRGGALSILAGNHDRWLCPYYERTLGATIVAEPLDITVHGLRLHLVHGHLLGARKLWKSLMESQPFFRAFGRIPSTVAGVLDRLLERKNLAELERDESRHLAVYREFSVTKRGRNDIVVIGHVHRAVDDERSDPRMIVLGGWQHRSSFLRIDPSGATFRVVPDAAAEPLATAAPHQPTSTPPRLSSP